ncbi:16S rRNA (uracil(1498)-N(3))-methyltransferase [uncultured Ruthenibacterium sp.]|uniref:RsmE family RNA methyltransferase n=1 Tax=uncultured Ruthenibacterium sp. TaxID=1905347 RepID=UPI00349E8B55
MPHRYFTTEIETDRAFLSGADARHLAVVLRAKPGMNVTLCDGQGTDYACCVRNADPDRVEMEIISRCPSASEPSVPVTLYVGYPKQDKLEWIIQKGVELGAVNIVPFFSRFCVAAPKKEEAKNERYNRIAFEAAKQAGRGVIPRVSMPLSYTQMLSEASSKDLALLCYEAGGEPLLSRLEGPVASLAIITGSEGGFSPEEAQAAVLRNGPAGSTGGGNGSDRQFTIAAGQRDTHIQSTPFRPRREREF